MGDIHFDADGYANRRLTRRTVNNMGLTMPDRFSPYSNTNRRQSPSTVPRSSRGRGRGHSRPSAAADPVANPEVIQEEIQLETSSSSSSSGQATLPVISPPILSTRSDHSSSSTLTTSATTVPIVTIASSIQTVTAPMAPQQQAPRSVDRNQSRASPIQQPGASVSRRRVPVHRQATFNGPAPLPIIPGPPLLAPPPFSSVTPPYLQQQQIVQQQIIQQQNLFQQQMLQQQFFQQQQLLQLQQQQQLYAMSQHVPHHYAPINPNNGQHRRQSVPQPQPARRQAPAAANQPNAAPVPPPPIVPVPPPPCFFCYLKQLPNPDGHLSEACPAMPKVSTRRKFLSNRGLCFACFIGKHNGRVERCPGSCAYCAREGAPPPDHHIACCILKEKGRPPQ